MQKIYKGDGSFRQINAFLRQTGARHVFIVSGKNSFKLKAGTAFVDSGGKYTLFDGFSPNPTYDDILKGLEIYKNSRADAIVAIGGGSAMDTAKCIRAFAVMDSSKSYLSQPIPHSPVPFFAVPTTAGTGSESTRYTVFYYKGEKQSLASQELLPTHVLLDGSLLNSLPVYQKKCTFLDALCQAAESYWSVHSTRLSKYYAALAIKGLLANVKGYIAGDTTVNNAVLLASNYSGRAINITATTAPHAMGYKITTLYGIPHGHAVGLGMSAVWRHSLSAGADIADKRGKTYFYQTLRQLALLFGSNTAKGGLEVYDALLSGFSLPSPRIKSQAELAELVQSVNQSRLANNPVRLPPEVIQNLYTQMLD